MDLQIMTLIMFQFLLVLVHICLPCWLPSSRAVGACTSHPLIVSHPLLSPRHNFISWPSFFVKNLSPNFLLSIFVSLLMLLFPIFCDYKRNNVIFKIVHLIYYSKMTVIKKSNNMLGGCGEKGTLLHFWWEWKLVQILWKSVWIFLKNIKLELPCHPVVLF